MNKKQTSASKPPVVVILGHVDHGKSSLLEAIKDFKITSKESGGITQHIGAYQIEHSGKTITFIDTPGHEAFESMRQRGVKIADVAVLVVAAEEGIKPQTKEAISHIKKSGIPVIVAINKVDKPEADPEKVKRDLILQDIIVESMGGKVPSVNTSAKTKKGITDLLEMIILISEMENLTADFKSPAEGAVIESYTDAKKGSVATLLVSKGLLKENDIIGTSSSQGKVRSIRDFQGNIIREAPPSTPVQVIGFEKSPGAGEKFLVFKDFETAKKNVLTKIIEKQKKGLPQEKSVNLIVKADVSGSIEAIENILASLPQEKIRLNIVKSGTGEINDSDVRLAKNLNSFIFGFRVKPNAIAQKLAEREKVRIMTFEVIYEMIQAARQAMERKLEPETVKSYMGKIKVLAIFKTDKTKQIIGGKVMNGEIRRNSKADIIRSQETLGQAKILKVQQDKQDVEKALKGRECGILIDSEIPILEGDLLEAFAEKKQAASL